MRTSDLRDSAVSPARAVHSLRFGTKAVLGWKSRLTLNWTAEIPFWQMTNRQIATSKSVKNSSWLANIAPWVTPNANSDLILAWRRFMTAHRRQHRQCRGEAREAFPYDIGFEFASGRGIGVDELQGARYLSCAHAKPGWINHKPAKRPWERPAEGCRGLPAPCPGSVHPHSCISHCSLCLPRASISTWFRSTSRRGLRWSPSKWPDRSRISVRAAYHSGMEILDAARSQECLSHVEF